TIRKITSGGAVSTVGLAGVSGSTDSPPRFNSPRGVTVDGSGNAYVADTNNSTIRRVSSGGVVTTVAGTAGMVGSTDATGTAARFDMPYGVAADTFGNLFVADTLNHTIRKITSSSVVTTPAGTPGMFGSTDDTAGAARFFNPTGVFADGSGNVF